jgi:cyclic 2,3-diphosphoglycerate synthetase
MRGVAEGPVIALIDGEHHPAVVRDALERLDRERGLAAVGVCGGEEKLPDAPLDEVYGRPVSVSAEAALWQAHGEAVAVVDLADEPALPPSAKLQVAALALHLGLPFEAPGARLDPPVLHPVPDFGGPTFAVIGTGKRTGKTALAGHWARLLGDAVIVCMGRGGPAEPLVAEPGLSLDDLLGLADEGRHAASDYLEDAVLAGVRTVGCRRLGGGLAGIPYESNVFEGAALAASLRPRAIVFEGSGSCIPPLEVDRTVCIVGTGASEPLADLRLLRADLLLAPPGRAAPPHALRFVLRSEPVEEVPDGARVAAFTTGGPAPPGALVSSANLARRAALAADLDRAVAEGCDVWLTELKAAAIDTVARRARAEGARVIFLRNRPIGVDDDLDLALERLVRDAH